MSQALALRQQVTRCSAYRPNVLEALCTVAPRHRAWQQQQQHWRCHASKSSHHEGSLSKAVPWLSSLDVWHSAPATSHNGNGNGNGNGPERPTDLDAVLILAGGLTPDGGCPPWVQRRLDTAAGLYALQSSRACPILCIGGGTPHKPPVVGPDGYVVHEATSCARYLMAKHGVPPHHILKEISSYDTVGNAYFAAVTHALPAGWRRVAVVTSAFHTPRARALFTAMWAKAARDVAQDPHRYTLWFAASSDAGLWPQDVLDARIAKEAASQAAWEATVATLPTFADIHAWLYTTHQCYAVSRQHEANRSNITDKRILDSY